MKRLTHIFGIFVIGALAGAATVSCAEEELIEPEQPKSPTAFEYVGNPIEAYLDITVEGLTVAAQTKADSGYGTVDDTNAERMVYNLWVFQYDAETETLISYPEYIVDYLKIGADNQELLRNVPVTLSDNDGKPSIVYVVTNTDDENWGKPDGSYTGFTTLTELKQQTIPNPAPIRITYVSGDGGTEESAVSIPMGGSAGEDETLTISKGTVVKVPVKRMFAKLMTWINLTESEDYEGSKVTSFMIDKIPNSCTVATNYVNDKWYYPSIGTYDVSREFDDPGEGTEGENGELIYGPFIIYIPENLQGEKSDAVKVTPYIYAKVNGAEISSRPSYPAYPGSWCDSSDTGEGSNYEIQRNCVYYITMNVEVNDYDTLTPSANCIIVQVGQTVAFFPYVRDEQLTDEMSSTDELTERYTFSNYLDWTDESKTKTIDEVKLIWQTEGFLGNNASEIEENLWIDDPEDVIDEEHRKIYVHALTYGNALIGGYNDGVLLWSWHIWRPQVDPESTAIEYYHIQWDENGIYEDNYVPGRLVMTLNLGAIHATPEDGAGSLDTDTYGMLYQWGRKDPFPPYKTTPNVLGYKLGVSFFNYSDYDITGLSQSREYNIALDVYDGNNQIVYSYGNDGSIETRDEDYLFNTNAASDVPGGNIDQTNYAVIHYSVQHPTTFIAASPKFDSTTSGEGVYIDDITKYYHQGDWLPDRDDMLWGGGHPGSGEFQVYSQDEGDSIDAYLEDDYGKEKTIFDPCPYGWRVSPGDLWLGFTKNGLNYGHTKNSSNDFYDNCNAVEDETLVDIVQQTGFTMYMQGWHGTKGSATSFFPTQGSRVSSGQPYNIGPICGNYHNATVDEPMTYSDDTYGSGTVRRVDILHFHSQNTTGQATQVDGEYVLLRTFTTELHYYNKSVAGPLRCVRDTDL